MKMLSLRSLAIIALMVLLTALLPAGADANGIFAAQKTRLAAADGKASGGAGAVKSGSSQQIMGEGKLEASDVAPAGDSADADKPADRNEKPDKSQMSTSGKGKSDKSQSDKSKSDKSKSDKGKTDKPKAASAKDDKDSDDQDAAATDKKSGKKSKADKKAEKEAATPLTSAEEEALAAQNERARILKSMSTPFNTSSQSSQSQTTAFAPMTLPPSSSGSRSLLSRLVPNRVYLPGKIVIGKATEFVVKGHPGYQAAIAMADKDSGAKPIGNLTLRLGPDRKLMAAGTIPASGVLTLIVDMPIQGDLIGQAVFFETVLWQKPDFSDIELAQPVKSESAKEIADKANAIIVAEENQVKRGLRFVPESGVPQLPPTGLDSGRP